MQVYAPIDCLYILHTHAGVRLIDSSKSLSLYSLKSHNTVTMAPTRATPPADPTA